MLCYELSCPKGRLLLSLLMFKDTDPNQYAVPGVDCVMSHESRQCADDGHKALLGHLRHLLRVGHALLAPYPQNSSGIHRSLFNSKAKYDVFHRRRFSWTTATMHLS